MRSLPLFLRLTGRPVILLGTGEAADSKRRLLERAGAVVVDDPDADAVLAVVALPDSEADTAAIRLKAKGLLVNVVDRPDLCDFTTPAIVDRDPVLIAIGTGGASAGLAKQLRLRLEALLPAELGKLASGLDAAKGALRERFPDARQRRQALDSALTTGGALDPLREHSADAVDRWLQSDLDAPNALVRHQLTIASADPEELTLRAARLLGEADIVVYDAAIAPAILARARADAVLVPAGADFAVPASGVILILSV
jgi:uroporphyrin-III C-methyltransferase / precorrin-2 dehydrogenase / sirohydrochlorin ferrochelatase